VEAMLVVVEDIELGVNESDMRPFESVVNLDPSKGPKGPKGIRVRPMFEKWAGSTEVITVDDALSQDVLARNFDMAGKLGGLGDGRAIGMGRCKITLTPINGG